MPRPRLRGDAHGRKVLEDLCKAYHRPVEAFLLARGVPNEEMEDLVQDFFLRWLRSRAWKRADRERGRAWEEVFTITPPQDIPIVRMAFSPDSRHLYTTGGQISHRRDVEKLHAELTALGVGWYQPLGGGMTE